MAAMTSQQRVLSSMAKQKSQAETVAATQAVQVAGIVDAEALEQGLGGGLQGVKASDREGLGQAQGNEVTAIAKG